MAIDMSGGTKEYLNAIFGHGRLTEDEAINKLRQNYEGLLITGAPRDLDTEQQIKLNMYETGNFRKQYSLDDIHDLHEEMKLFNKTSTQMFHNLADYIQYKQSLEKKDNS